MSALTVLSEYGSESEESDHETKTKRIKLPKPNLSKIEIIPTENHSDDPVLHGGRTRSFPHVRGNWATFVFVKYPENEGTNSIIHNILKLLSKDFDDTWNICEDFHISLSKTVVLQFHLIEPFTKSLQANLKESECFELNFNAVKIYCNEEATRTFIALELDYFSQRSISKITEKVDKALTEYNLPTFYTKPSFHMSILWVNGDHRNQLLNYIPHINNIVTKEIGNKLHTITIDKINCKSGNKYYQYFLEKDGNP